MLSVCEIFLFTTRNLAVMHTVFFCLIVTGDTTLRNKDGRSVTSADLRMRAILFHVHCVYFFVCGLFNDTAIILGFVPSNGANSD